MKRIYLDAALQAGREVQLPEDVHHYVARVLRCRAQERLCFFNGDGCNYFATLIAVDKRQSTIVVDEMDDSNRESPLHTTLIQGLSKGERMDVVMQKAVELGVNAIIPVRTEFCAVKLDEKRLVKKMQHWRSVIISACEQSERSVVPVLHPLMSLEEARTLSQHAQPDALSIMLHPYPAGQEESLSLSTAQPHSVSAYIGPEGGFSESEVSMLLEGGVRPMQLGPRILRTETAAIAALSVCQQLWGDWHVS